MKRFIANTALIAMTVLVMAAGFEFACRTIADTGMQYDLEMWKYAVKLKRIAADPAIGHEHIPNTRAHLMGVDVAINSRGLRSPEVPDIKAEGTTRILMLGDSIAFGWGVREDETASARLQKLLTEARHEPVEVIDTGVGNYNTAMEVAYFLKHGAALRPDIVVLNYFINDAEPTPTYRPIPWLARHSYAYAITGGAWDTFKRLVLGGQDWRAYYAGLYRPDAEGWRAAQASLADLAVYCHKHGIRFVLANIPEFRQLKDYPFADVNAKLKEIAAARGIEYVDLLPALAGEDPASLWVTKPDPHPNAKAHALMARALADYLLAAPATAEP